MHPNRRIASTYLLLFALTALLSVGCRAQAPAASLRDEFRRLVMADRKPGPLAPEAISLKEAGAVVIERVRFTPEEGESAVALIYRPKAEGKHPAVIVQHFLGGSKDYELLAFLYGNLASKGYLVAAIDGRFRGERQQGKALQAAMAEALRTGKGHPFLIDTVFDDLRLIDYLVTRPDVDAARIGMTGFSEGGIETWMTAAIDDRIKVAVPVIGVTTFGETLQTEGMEAEARVKLFGPLLADYAKTLGESEVTPRVLRTAWDKLVPGMLDRFDAPNLLPLIAPRPLLIISHEKDELFPVAGAKKAFAAAQARYKELGAEDRVSHSVTPGLNHAGYNLLTVAAEAGAVASWFDRWLKPAAETK
jgi:dienelactone hydrolase